MHKVRESWDYLNVTFDPGTLCIAVKIVVLHATKDAIIGFAGWRIKMEDGR